MCVCGCKFAHTHDYNFWHFSLLKGLLKARSILSEDFGSVHIHLDEPISVRLFSVGHVDRTIHSLEPR